MEKSINLTSEAVYAIDGLRHNNGTLNLFRDTLTRVFNQILHTAEDMGMDGIEALGTLQALDMLRRDITAIATEPRPEQVEAVAQFYEAEGDEAESDEADSELDEPREMLADVKRGLRSLDRTAQIIMEAACHAERAGKKYRCVLTDLREIIDALDETVARLDTIMAIDPDTFDQK